MPGEPPQAGPERPAAGHRFASLRFASHRGEAVARGGRGGVPGEAEAARLGTAQHGSARQRKTPRESGSVPRPAAPPLPGTGREAAAPARPRPLEVSAAFGREGGGRRGARQARTAAGGCLTGHSYREQADEEDLFGDGFGWWCLVSIRGARRVAVCVLFSSVLCSFLSVCPCPARGRRPRRLAPAPVGSAGGGRVRLAAGGSEPGRLGVSEVRGSARAHCVLGAQN